MLEPDPSIGINILASISKERLIVAQLVMFKTPVKVEVQGLVAWLPVWLVAWLPGFQLQSTCMHHFLVQNFIFVVTEVAFLKGSKSMIAHFICPTPLQGQLLCKIDASLSILNLIFINPGFPVTAPIRIFNPPGCNRHLLEICV